LLFKKEEINNRSKIANCKLQMAWQMANILKRLTVTGSSLWFPWFWIQNHQDKSKRDLAVIL
jgi:hypothetical protein